MHAIGVKRRYGRTNDICEPADELDDVHVKAYPSVMSDPYFTRKDKTRIWAK